KVNRPVVLLFLVALWAASCDQSASTPTLPQETATPMLAPPTLIVTRVVERLVTATPVPTTAACQHGSLADAGEVVIGALAPLSRTGSLLTGFAMQTAFSIAADELNAAGGGGGKPVRLITYDTAGSADQAGRFAERLILLDCAAVLVGGYNTQVALAIKAVAQKYGTPVIFSGAAQDELTADAAPEVFRINPTTGMMAAMPAQWLAEVGDYNGDHERHVVLIAENNTDARAYFERVRQNLIDAGFAVEVLTVELPASDFSPVIARIVALDLVPDAVLIGVSGDAAFALQQQMLAAGIGPQQRTLLVTNSSALNDTLFWNRMPNGLYTVVSRLGPWPSTVSARGAQFVEKFRTYFDRWPDIYTFAA
ncbi:MAG TPA: ABC transporter substrate-binding protein, partial [Caldilineaceae bacterium]|nr:ABC transporter substrate-binding protein [Caldilineaceae bacterium]